MERIRIKDLPHRDRPYEKCLRLGPHSLSDTELLAVILRTGSREGNSLDLADSLLALGSPGDGLLGLLHHSLDDFTGIKGVGKVNGVQLLCIGELSKRIWKRKASEHALYFGHPEEISDYYMEDMRHLEQEEIRVMFLICQRTAFSPPVLMAGYSIHGIFLSIQEETFPGYNFIFTDTQRLYHFINHPSLLLQTGYYLI